MKKNDIYKTASFGGEPAKKRAEYEQRKKRLADQQSAARITKRGWKKFVQDISSRFSGVGQQDRVLVFRQLSQMIVVDIPITQAIDSIRIQATNRRVLMILSDIYLKVTQGVAFSSACSYHLELFLPIYVPLLQSGEVGGNLDIILEDIAGHAEDQWRIQRNVINNLTYPTRSLSISGNRGTGDFSSGSSLISGG